MIETDFNILKGEIFTNILVDGEEIITFHCKSGAVYKMFHQQECCENVYLEKTDGLENILRSKVLHAEESSSDSETNPDGTWYFYKIVTETGIATLRWYGESNGYYSTDATLFCTRAPKWEKIDMYNVEEVTKWGILTKRLERSCY